jgi:MFS family permease
MAIFALGPHVGLLLGFVLGGWVNQAYGWRFAFLIAGFPGLLLAAVLHWTLRDPARGRADDLSVGTTVPVRFTAVCRDIWAQPSLRHVFAGAALASFLAYAVITWLPAYLARSHRMGTGAIGVVLALIVGVAGTYCGGQLADMLSRRGEAWRVRVIAIGLVVSPPFWIGVFLAETPAVLLSVLILPGVLVGLFVGPTFAIVQALVDVRCRAVAAAILLFVGNLIGLGLGPLAVGALSDFLHPRWGADSLRFALLIVVPVSLWAAFHYVWAGRTLGRDLARARALQTHE